MSTTTQNTTTPSVKTSLTRRLTFSALAIALAFVTGNIKLFDMPMGGSVTLLGTFFICLVGYWYGIGAGAIAGIAYGLIQLLFDPYIISIPQLMIDYIFAFMALGALSGLGRNRKFGLSLGYLAGCLGRYFFAVLSGVVFFASYAPETMNPVVYSLVYNILYIAAEAAITLVIINIPVVRNALDKVKEMAVGVESRESVANETV
ncbi:MAG: energy-coupled thiamine transporter ThiT [Eubacterium sp.]|nr:energy-coupled thiamine transporter ThiT [Eubacterium sp.]